MTKPPVQVLLNALQDAQGDPDVAAIYARGVANLLDMESEQPTLCAWCLAEQGIAPRREDSHGVCERHAARMREQSRARRAARCVA